MNQIPENSELNLNLSQKDILVFDNLENALVNVGNEEEIFIIGGQDIYSQTINKANKLYLTTINDDIEGDKFFPYFDNSNWDIVDTKYYKKNKNNTHDFKSEILIKKINT